MVVAVQIGTQVVFDLVVASRTIIRAFMEQIRVRSVPFFHGLHRRFALQRRLGQLVAVQSHVAHQGLLKVLPNVEVMRFGTSCFTDRRSAVRRVRDGDSIRSNVRPRVIFVMSWIKKPTTNRVYNYSV